MSSKFLTVALVAAMANCAFAKEPLNSAFFKGTFNESLQCSPGVCKKTVQHTNYMVVVVPVNEAQVQGFNDDTYVTVYTMDRLITFNLGMDPSYNPGKKSAVLKTPVNIEGVPGLATVKAEWNNSRMRVTVYAAPSEVTFQPNVKNKSSLEKNGPKEVTSDFEVSIETGDGTVAYESSILVDQSFGVLAKEMPSGAGTTQFVGFAVSRGLSQE